MNPTKFGWIYRYYDEIYFCINAAIQQHYLRIYGGSLAEVFYSLTRSRVFIDRFDKRDRFVSFVCIVLLPYVRSKIANLIQRWSDECENGATTVPLTLEHRKIAITAYRSWCTIQDCLQLVQFIMYLANLSKSHSIANRLIGVQLKYMPTEMNMRWTWSDLFTGNFRNPAIFTGLLFRTLELSAFFLQFVQWWQNESTHGSLTKLPSPEAPAPNAGESRYGNLCPICLQTWKIPTANRISGWVHIETISAEALRHSRLLKCSRSPPISATYFVIDAL